MPESREQTGKKKNKLLAILFSIAFALFVLIRSKLFIGFIVGVFTILAGHQAIEYTSSDQFCESCHVHPHATESWKKSTHFENKSGVVVHCIECHLPPGGTEFYTEKARLGFQDLYGKLFKDISKINWEAKGKLEHAVTYTYDPSCVRCHNNLFPLGLSKKGSDAHIYYLKKKEQVRCINCHLTVGHYSEKAVKEQGIPLLIKKKGKVQYYTKPATVRSFEDYTEFIPNTPVKFDMVAIPGGDFIMGSPDSEPFRRADEGPQHKVHISPFWMGKFEVSWDEYQAFYLATSTGEKFSNAEVTNLDAITGPTPPYGSPDQGWGRGMRPAITMTHFAATKYCQWLSKVTGKTYRLPTEAEWEYACRANTTGPYFFDGDPKKLTQRRWLNKIFKPDTSLINRYVIYQLNSNGKTQPALSVQPNPFGLYHMLGNVKEFCSDWYDARAYELYAHDQIVSDPTGPASGTEHVVRGGSFKSDPADLRCAAREWTHTDEWLMTDPQSPKSIWWYSDCNDVGFRVVCEYHDNN